MADKLQNPLDIVELSASPGSPGSGYQRIYAKTDGKFYVKTSGGVEVELTQYKVPTFGVSDSSVISTGAKSKTFIQLPYAGVIVGWYLTSVEAATMTLDIWANDSAYPTNSDSICASAKPSLTASRFASSTTLTGWTTTSAAGKKYLIEVESNDLSTDFKLTLLML